MSSASRLAPRASRMLERLALAAPVVFRHRKDAPAARLTTGETARGFFFQSTGPNGCHGFLADLTVERDWYLELRDLGSA